MNERYFFEGEIREAKNLLTVLAQVSARFWAEALLSDQFMYKGKVSYIDTSYYKSGSWRDYPSTNKEEITAKQVMTFIKAYEEEAEKTFERCLSNNTDVARILGMDVNDITENPRFAEDGTKLEFDWEYYSGFGVSGFSFGGWDNDPYGAVAVAKKAAGIDGAMRVNSSYRKTSIELKNRKIVIHRYGSKKVLMEV